MSIKMNSNCYVVLLNVYMRGPDIQNVPYLLKRVGRVMVFVGIESKEEQGDVVGGHTPDSTKQTDCLRGKGIET